MKRTQRSFNSTIRKTAPPKKTNPARRAKTSSLPWKRMMKAERLRRKREKEAREYARKYGSQERVEFVKTLPCAACGVVGYSENAHLLGNGGMGRKEDADTVGPLCGAGRLVTWKARYVCHTLYDENRSLFTALYPDFDPEKVARETEELFRASLGSSPGGQQK